MPYQVYFTEPTADTAKGVNYTYDVRADFPGHHSGSEGPAETLEQAIEKVKHRLREYSEQKHGDLPRPNPGNVELVEPSVIPEETVDRVSKADIMP